MANGEYHHLYDRRWRAARRAFLDANPLCLMCKAQGIRTQANIVDHIKAHRGDLALFWDPSNWQPMCAHHHNSHKQSLEKGGHGRQVIGVDGWPIG